jgi:hypothetical protein
MSDPILLSEEYTVVIDTNSLSKEFANALCAYCTGVVDERDEARQYSDLFYMERSIEDDDSPRGKVAEEKSPFYDFVGQRFVESENYSPCCVWLNKRYGCNEDYEFSLLTEENYEEYSFPAPLSVGIFFDIKPNLEHLEIIKERAFLFFDKVWKKNKVEVEGFRLICHTKYGQEIGI